MISHHPKSNIIQFKPKPTQHHYYWCCFELTLLHHQVYAAVFTTTSCQAIQLLVLVPGATSFLHLHTKRIFSLNYFFCAQAHLKLYYLFACLNFSSYAFLTVSRRPSLLKPPRPIINGFEFSTFRPALDISPATTANFTALHVYTSMSFYR